MITIIPVTAACPHCSRLITIPIQVVAQRSGEITVKPVHPDWEHE